MGFVLHSHLHGYLESGNSCRLSVCAVVDRVSGVFRCLFWSHLQHAGLFDGSYYLEKFGLFCVCRLDRCVAQKGD